MARPEIARAGLHQKKMLFSTGRWRRQNFGKILLSPHFCVA
ncbi:hypothetical protein SAMCFNEI73_pC0639 (plasmid) [Sinorhizobium americanum]|uniref:Uncharacterized protein n=1 Tax=Sinorhizobium americanum TaxID=194963 RepID=A0A1L3LW66_9HYPH|nr:hypothetical protein SAMCFNEI73_pC0639 [Sinorhizobium americanum]